MSHSELHNTAKALSHWHETWTLSRLAGPIIIGQFAQTANGFIDAAMAGRYSAQDLAAVGVGSSVWILMFLVFTHLLLATTPLVAHAYGARRLFDVSRWVHQALWLALLLGALSVFMLWRSDTFLGLIGVNEDLRTPSYEYLSALAWGMPAIMLFAPLRGYVEGLGFTRPVMVVSLLGLLLNIPLNYIFIFGYWGLPAMGAEGCGWATAIVMWVMLILLASHAIFNSRYEDVPLFRYGVAPNLKKLIRFLRLGIPLGLTVFFEVSIFSVIALMISGLGEQIVAGHQVALNFSTLLFMIPLSMSMALTIRIGQKLGAKRFDYALLSCKCGLMFNIAFAIASTALLLLARDQIPRLYTDDKQVIAIASQLLLWAAAFQVVDGIQAAAFGSLRGFKDTRTPMLIAMFSYWCVGLPLGHHLAFDGDLGAEGFWVSLFVGLTLAAVLLGARLLWKLQAESKHPYH